jgi:hypothetical protein
MEKVVIQEQLKNCPSMIYYPRFNRLELVGRSIPENPEAIYLRLEEWISSHLDRSSSLDVCIQLEYINSGSSKYLYGILRKLTDYRNQGKNVNMRWRYEEDDEAMQELGEHYRDSAGIPLIIEMIV